MYEREKRKKNSRRRRRRRRILIRRMLIFCMAAALVLAGTGIYVCIQKFRSVDIVLDAGHGGKDQGASAGNVLEKEINLEITKKTKKILEEAGYRVGMVRDNDTFVELGQRAAYANQKEARVFVSIHCNSAEEAADGIETFYAEQKEAESQELAQCIQEHMIGRTSARDREVKTADYAVILRTDMPAALTEVGFLSDAAECEALQQEVYQEKLAEGIAEGILTYLQNHDI